MPRGRQLLPHHSGFTKEELLSSSGLSAKTFDMIRKAARVRGPSHGGLQWVFSPADVAALIQRAQSGTFTDRGPPAANAWQALLQSPDGPAPAQPTGRA
jgi:hypothetical protein